MTDGLSTEALKVAITPLQGRGADRRFAETSQSEDAFVERSGYKPELRRTLRFFSMFAIAFSIISITTGIFLNYGFGLANWGPASIWTWPIVAVGNTFIAFVVAELPVSSRLRKVNRRTRTPINSGLSSPVPHAYCERPGPWPAAPAATPAPSFGGCW